MWKKVILGIIGATTLSLGGLVLTDKEAKPLTVTNIPEKIDTQSQTINFGDVPPHTTTVDSAGLISIDVGDKRYTIEPLKLESDKAEGTKAKSPALKIESDGDDVYIKEAWGATSEIKLTNTREAFSKVVSFSQNDFKSLARGTKYIEVKFEITGFEVPDGIYSNRIEIQPNVWLEKGKAWDSSPGDEANDIPNQNYTDVEFEVIGNTLIKRIPVEWFNTATFPVYTDAVFTFGTKQLFDTGVVGTVDVLKIGTNKVANCWFDNANATTEGECIVGTVSGTAFTFGSASTFVADASILTGNNTAGSACEAGNDRWVVVFEEDTTFDGVARVASSTGTTINGYGSPLVFENLAAPFPVCSYIATDKVAITWTDNSNRTIETIACTITASYTLSCGATTTVVTTPATTFIDISCATTGTDKYVCMYENTTNTDTFIFAASVSGTTVTAGAVATSSTVDQDNIGHVIVSPDTDKFVYSYGNSTLTSHVVGLGTISGTTVTLGATSTLFATTSSVTSLVALDTDTVVWMGQYGTTDGAATFLAAIPLELNFGLLTFSSSTAEQVDATTDPGSLHAAKIGDCKFAFVWEDDNDTNDLFAIIGDTAGCVVDSVRDSGIIWFD